MVSKVLRFLRTGALKVKSLANSSSERQLSGCSSPKPGSEAEMDSFRAASCQETEDHLQPEEVLMGPSHISCEDGGGRTGRRRGRRKWTYGSEPTQVVFTVFQEGEVEQKAEACQDCHATLQLNVHVSVSSKGLRDGKRLTSASGQH